MYCDLENIFFMGWLVVAFGMPLKYILTQEIKREREESGNSGQVHCMHSW